MLRTLSGVGRKGAAAAAHAERHRCHARRIAGASAASVAAIDGSCGCCCDAYAAALRMAAAASFGSFTEHTLGESVRIHVVLMDGKNAELLKDGMGMVRGY